MKPITQENDRLGFVGIGYMGRPIARRLLESGFQLTVYDRDRAKAEELVEHGGNVAQSVSELSSNCAVVLSCLPTEEAVVDIYTGRDGVFSNARHGLKVIDLSTVYPETARKLSSQGSEHGVEVLDVTMSGSTPAAENGLLTLFGGGNKECFDAAEPIFRVIAQKYFYLGPSGSGATMKLVVNTLLGIGMQAIAEAVALGEKAGLDRNRLLEVLSQTAVVAPALTNIEILELDRLPEHLIVIGGGYVGLEFAQAYRRFGSRVTILEQGPHLLADKDPDVAAELLQIFASEGIDVMAPAEIFIVHGRSGTGVSLIVRTSFGEKAIAGSDILVATGRIPNTAGIGLEAAGVELDQRGYVKVDDRLQTTAPQCLGYW
jgi:3-hydroxyisobutyrate dehydrogenase